jgi:putative membrane protein
VNIVALVGVMHIVRGINADTWQTIIVAALVLGLINVFLKPLVILLTLPLNILSLGLFTLIVNGAVFYLVSKLVIGFQIVNFKSAFWGALWFSVISFFLNLLISPQGKVDVHFYEYRSGPRQKYRDAIDAEAEVEDDDREGRLP